jgi:hypothetical protein
LTGRNDYVAAQRSVRANSVSYQIPGQVTKRPRRRQCSALAVSSAGSDPLARSSSVGFSAHFRNLYPGTRVRGARETAGCMQAGPIGVPATLIHKNRYWKFGSERHAITSPYKEARRNLWLATGRPKTVLFVQGRREKITTDRHFADGESEVACQSSLRHVAASADRKRRRNVLRFFVDGQE